MNPVRRKSISLVISLLLALGAAAPAQAGNVRNSSRTNVNVNRHVDRHGGCCYHDRHHPIATAAAVTTAAVVGSIVYSIPPGCLATRSCGSGRRRRRTASRVLLPPAAVLLQACGASTDQRVSRLYAGEASEVPIGSPEFGHAVFCAQCRYPGVMGLRARYPAAQQQGTKVLPVIRRLGEQDNSRRFDPGVNLFDGAVERCRRRVDPRVGHNGDELVNARPGDCPRLLPLGQFGDAGIGGIMPRGVFPVRIDQQVGVYGDHPPRPS